MTRRSIIRLILGFVLVVLLGIGGYWRSLYISNPARWGETMGTSFSIRIAGKVKRSDLKKLSQEIENELTEINRQMSTWDPTSEISRFNHTKSTEPIPVSTDFAKVVKRALEFSKITNGSFDPTLQPLLNLWGFGSEAVEQKIPSDDEIADAKSKTGWCKVNVEDESCLRKSSPEVSLALGAIAKGYGVDAIARILEDEGYENWFVEIGGEVDVKGLNPDGMPWRVGIQYPSTNPFDDSLQGVLHMTKGAVATSGNYRNYREDNGVFYTHILDPRSGRSVISNVASVSVFASNCTDADGIATALFVMGAEEGLKWVEQQPGIEALFLVRGQGGEIIEKNSSGFVKTTGYTSTRASAFTRSK